MPRLDAWEYDGKVFTGFLYGHEHFEEGQIFATGANFVDWEARKITVGTEVIELGAPRSDLLNSEQDVGQTEEDFPW